MLAWLSRDERISCCRWSCNIFKTGFVLRPLFKGFFSESTLFLLRLVSVSDGENLRLYVKTIAAGDNDNEETICNVSHPAPPDLLKYAQIKYLYQHNWKTTLS